MTLPLDPTKSIPVGSDLRILLNSDHISYGQIHNTLKSKGIYVGDSDKSITVPLLAATILKPSEFSQLIEESINREQRPKTKVAGIKLVSPASDWISPLKEGMASEQFEPGDKNGCVEFTSEPSIVVLSPEKITVDYEIKRKDYSEDWINRELTFPGKLSIEKSGEGLKLEVCSTHSSKETDAINKRIINKVAKILKSAGISESEEPSKITFGSFTHIERVRFFKRLAGGHDAIKVGNVNDIEIGREGMEPLPNDPRISWMTNRVRRLKIDGSKLHEIFLVSDENYYQYYYIPRMDVTYPFEIGANSGNIKVRFSFAIPKKEEDRELLELESEILGTHFGIRPNPDAKKMVEQQLDREVRALIEKQFSVILSEREPKSAEPANA